VQGLCSNRGSQGLYIINQKIFKIGEKMIKENGKIVRCEKCGSDNIEIVMPFDYIKMCMNDECPYHVNHPKGWRWQFSTGIHN